MRNTGIANLVVQKFNFGGLLWGGSEGGGTLKLCRNICLLSICRYQKKKKLATYFEPNEKLIFDGSILAGPRGMVFPNDVKTFVS